MNEDCSFDGVEIRPDGVHPLDVHLYKDVEIHRNVTVIVSRCVKCGHTGISWVRQDDTEDEYLEVNVE